ncbi:hypothetical protein [Congregibacter litoralis]|uniref:Uncharacterized protein n=1 Tax=Congregibacter litoralis KT71 TaxID=314285 RepID=A4AB51_9GAMM|nr:hypothetical protein [Congregibacter litoralis]EAQ96923.1 hypothetical protein KT71_11499 [Congregibacter litoralis KT71]
MTAKNETFELVDVDPWGKNNGGLVPKNASLVCIYGLNLGPDSITEALYLRIFNEHVELWFAHPRSHDLDNAASPSSLAFSDKQARAVLANRSGDTNTDAQSLFIALIRARWGHAWPGRFYVPGVLSEQVYQKTLTGIAREGDLMASQASAIETSVVRTARELRLQPEPTGTSPSAWRARCSETNHSLYISTDSNTFGCGYCRRKGGEDELRAFVGDRRQGGAPPTMVAQGREDENS